MAPRQSTIILSLSFGYFTFGSAFKAIAFLLSKSVAIFMVVREA